MALRDPPCAAGPREAGGFACPTRPRGTLLLGLALAASCGGAAPARRRGSSADFVCNERHAEYVLAGGFVAAESGVIVECDKGGARLTKWSLAEGASQRAQRAFALDGAQFDDIWRELEDAGWRNLDDCNNPDAADTDPVYTFEISDYAGRVTLTCAGRELPFPFDRVVNALDTPAGQLGND